MGIKKKIEKILELTKSVQQKMENEENCAEVIKELYILKNEVENAIVKMETEELIKKISLEKDKENKKEHVKKTVEKLLSLK